MGARDSPLAQLPIAQPPPPPRLRMDSPAEMQQKRNRLNLVLGTLGLGMLGRMAVLGRLGWFAGLGEALNRRVALACLLAAAAWKVASAQRRQQHRLPPHTP